MLSVVIPVYNVEQSLARCVSTVLAQRGVDMEVVLVDDGSTDGSLALCRKLMATDSRIKLISKANGGLSSARNAGIEVARGDYITFVDSDDYLSDGVFLAAFSGMEAMSWPDIAEYGARLFVGAPWQRELKFGAKVYSSPVDYWFGAGVWSHCYACNKLFRRSLFDSVRFPEGKCFEDVWTLPQLLLQCQTVVTLPVVGYTYVYNPHGITSTADGGRYAQLLEADLAALDLITGEQRKSNQQGMARFYQHILNDQLTAYEMGATTLKLPLLDYNNTIKLKLLHILGLKRLCKLNKWIHKIRRPRH